MLSAAFHFSYQFPISISIFNFTQSIQIFSIILQCTGVCKYKIVSRGWENEGHLPPFPPECDSRYGPTPIARKYGITSQKKHIMFAKDGMNSK